MILEFFEEISSTQLYLKEKIERGEVLKDHFVLAQQQTQGIATHGRSWESKKGESFLLSFTLDSSQVAKESYLTFFIAFVFKRLFLKEYGIPIQLKWPNDLYYKGKKLGGILTFKVEDLFLIGCGINLNQQVFLGEIERTAISLYQIDYTVRNSKDLLSLLMQYLERETTLWGEDSQYFWEELKGDWVYQNQQVQLSLEGNIVRGTFKEVDIDGHLCLINEKGEKTYNAGTITPL